MSRGWAFALFALGWVFLGLAPAASPEGGALAGNRYRVIVSTDIGGGDPDDFQSMVHYLIYADVFDTEGLISSPPGKGTSKDILATIDAYAKDYPNLRTWSDKYPTPEALRALTRDGARARAPKEGFAKPTDGSRWIVRQAKKDDARPLYVLVWGGMADVAQAVHDAPEIKKKIRVYSTGSWNTRNDPHARAYLFEKHPDLWWVEADTTFRGMYVGGDQKGDLDNREFVTKYVKGRGALGAFFFRKKADIKMGDTPCVLYLLRGDPNKPETDHWGGKFKKTDHGPNYWTDDPGPKLKEKAPAGLREKALAGAKTVNRWREEYLRDWQKRMERVVGKAGE